MSWLLSKYLYPKQDQITFEIYFLTHFLPTNYLSKKGMFLIPHFFINAIIEPTTDYTSASLSNISEILLPH
jgi:hypothetical protein